MDEQRPAKIRRLNAGDGSLTSKFASNGPGFGADQPIETAPKSESAAEPLDKVTRNSEVEQSNQQNRDGQSHFEEHLPEVGEDASVAIPKLSKNQLKKLRKKEEWEAGRGDRKIARKEKQKERKERKREERQAAHAIESEQIPGSENAEIMAQQPKTGTQAISKPPRASQLPIAIIVDCSWDDLMMEKELISLGGQLTRCYSDNHKSIYRAHLTVSSFGGRLHERFNSILEKQYLGWKGVRFLESDFVEAAKSAAIWMTPEAQGGHMRGQFSKFQGQEDKVKNQGEIIYLSSDAEETLTELKPYSVYIIGGLVDKNRYKGVCHKKACEKGVRTAKLPIGDYMQMASRYVLTVNHVNEIMLRWLELGDWGKAFEAVIPKRKGGVLKGSDEADTPDVQQAQGTNEKSKPLVEPDRMKSESEQTMLKSSSAQAIEQPQFVAESTQLHE